MTDTFSSSKRSWVMSRIRSSNTSPEKKVRSFLYKHKFCFRLHRKDLPGKPDVVILRLKTAIFIHGCFWHQCPLCRGGRLPKSNLVYWEAKFKKNQDRDKRNVENLESLGWKVITIWECQINEAGLQDLISNKLC